jgi:predicted ferric reductase
MNPLSGAFWIGLYLLVVLSPVFMMMAAPHPSGRTFWLELSVALGFVGLTQIAVQFALIARFRRVTAPYGIDVILRYHRQIAVVAVAFILLHPVIIVLDFPARGELLNPLGGNWASRLGWLSVFALAAIVVTSQYRKRLKIGYERWRIAHIALALVALVCAQAHVSMAGLYVNTVWKHALWIGIALGMVGFSAYLRLFRPLRQRQRPWKVVEVRRERGDSCSIVLEADGHDGLPFSPGQFAWLKIGKSPFTIDEHPFSFSSSATEPHRVEFGVKALGDFTRSLFDLEPGTRAHLDGPHGAFSIDRYPAPGYVMVAGGIGITPILSCLRTMAARGDRRPVLLFNAQKSWERATYREALEELAGQLDLQIVHVFEEAHEGWEGEQCLIDDAMLERRLPTEGIVRDYLLCGPPPLMRAVRDALRRRGVPETRIHSERFDLV